MQLCQAEWCGESFHGYGMKSRVVFRRSTPAIVRKVFSYLHVRFLRLVQEIWMRKVFLLQINLTNAHMCIS